MDASVIYILVAIISFLAIALIFFLVEKKHPKKLSKMTYISFIFVIMGTIFSENRYIGYGLMGIGIAIAVADIIIKKKKR